MLECVNISTTGSIKENWIPPSCAALISRQRLQWKRLEIIRSTISHFDDQIRCVGKYILSYLLTFLFIYRENARFFSFRELILQQIKIGRAKLAANCWARTDRYSTLKRVEPMDASDIANKRLFRVHRTRYNASYFSDIEEGSFLVIWWKYFLFPKSMPKSFVCTFLYTRSHRRAALLGNYSIRWKRQRKGGQVGKHVHGEYTRAHLPL